MLRGPAAGPRHPSQRAHWPLRHCPPPRSLRSGRPWPCAQLIEARPRPPRVKLPGDRSGNQSLRRRIRSATARDNLTSDESSVLLARDLLLLARSGLPASRFSTLSEPLGRQQRLGRPPFTPDSTNAPLNLAKFAGFFLDEAEGDGGSDPLSMDTFGFQTLKATTSFDS